MIGSRPRLFVELLRLMVSIYSVVGDLCNSNTHSNSLLFNGWPTAVLLMWKLLSMLANVCQDNMIYSMDKYNERMFYKKVGAQLNLFVYAYT